MQYIGYQYAKDNNIIGLVIYNWLKVTPDLNIHTRGHVLKDWREEKCLLNTGDFNSGSSIPKIIEEWEKYQANPKYHKKEYLKKYLERNLFKL